MDKFAKKVLVVSWLFFIITGALLFTIYLMMTEYKIPDPPNYVTIVVEIMIGFFIATLVYMITKKQQSDFERKEEERKIEEFQHYKERLLDELTTLVFRVDIAVMQFGKEEQKADMYANLNDAKVNLNGLRQINSIFTSPIQIRSQCDDLLSYYHILIESVIQGHLYESRLNSSRCSLAERVQKFIGNDFFSQNNNGIIDKKLAKLNDTLRQIFSKTK